MKSLQEYITEAFKKGRKVMSNDGTLAKAYMMILVMDGTMKKDIENFMTNNNAIEVIEDDTQKKEFLQFQSAAERASETMVLLYKNLSDAQKDLQSFKVPNGYELFGARGVNVQMFSLMSKDGPKEHDFIIGGKLDGSRYNF